jgi:hypothetical protein
MDVAVAHMTWSFCNPVSIHAGRLLVVWPSSLGAADKQARFWIGRLLDKPLPCFGRKAPSYREGLVVIVVKNAGLHLVDPTCRHMMSSSTTCCVLCMCTVYRDRKVKWVCSEAARH